MRQTTQRSVVDVARYRKHLDVMMTKSMMMGSGVFKAPPSPLQVVCVRMCVFYAAVCLAGWPPSSEAARLRCGSDLLDDIRFVCGDRGIYIGRATSTASTCCTCLGAWDTLQAFTCPQIMFCRIEGFGFSHISSNTRQTNLMLSSIARTQRAPLHYDPMSSSYGTFYRKV